jgi:raffinose/stachyose/melibiose transport system permease protein
MATMQAATADRAPRRGLLPTPDFFKNGAIQVVLGLNAILMLYPLFVMVMSSFKSNAEIFTSPLTLPGSFSFDNLLKVWTETNFLQYLINSLLVTGGSIILILTVSTMAAYAIARYPFKGNNVVLLFFLAGMTVPLKLAIIPLFIELDGLHLLDSYAGLILVYTATGIPSAVFIMTGFLRALPHELEESARMDGANEFVVLTQVMLPLARPAMVIVAIQNAVPIWNDFFFPLILITSDSLKTLPQGLTVFMGEFVTDWGVLFTGLTLAALPVTIFYIALSRQFIAGLTQGAVK